MFKNLVDQVQRLFSTKKNGGKQVPKLTDELHAYKLVFLLFSMALMLGYSQFRSHFKCQGLADIDSQQVTDFCLINGTTTVVNETDGGRSVGGLPTHVGLNFVTNSRDYRVINHNYMRSLWALMILLTISSYFARRYWASLFNNDVLTAILQLAGSDESRLVRAAEEAKPYEMLSLLSSSLDEEVHDKMKDPEVAQLSRSERVARKIQLVDQHVNIYDHALDYYPNQLSYLLLTKDVAAYKLSCLKLRRNLICYSVVSTLLTVMQFLVPLAFIGGEYLTYGWRFLVSCSEYLFRRIYLRTPVMENSIDYELSSTIFPIITQCEYKQFAMTGSMENYIVQCTVPINEICGKLFTAIWWVVVLNILIEIWSLVTISLSSVSVGTVRSWFGWRYWPNARKQADLIASFRFHRSTIQERNRKIQSNLSGDHSTLKSDSHITLGNQKLSDLERKQREAGDIPRRTASGRTKRWYHHSLHDLVSSASDAIKRLVCCCASERSARLLTEVERDINIYYLLYLIYLRLGKSKSKTERVIDMTSSVLRNYLNDLRAISEETFPSGDKGATKLAQQNVYSKLDKNQNLGFNSLMVENV